MALPIREDSSAKVTVDLWEVADFITTHVQKEVLAELNKLEEAADCPEDHCGLDAGLLVDQLLRRIRELEQSIKQGEQQ